MHYVVQIRSTILNPAAAAPWQDTKLHVLHRDYETRGHAILKTVGTYKYAIDPSTEVLCCAYAVDDGPVQLWTPGNPVPAEFIEAATNPAWIVSAHGAHFGTRSSNTFCVPVSVSLCLRLRSSAARRRCH